MPSDVTTRGWSMSMPGSPLAAVPTHTMRWSNSKRSPPATTASPSMTPCSRTTRTFLRLHAASTPERILRTTSSLRAIIRVKSMVGSGTMIPKSAALRILRSRSAPASSDLVGMQPQLRHVPPSSARSMSTVSAPSCAARRAATSPAGPPPSTTTRGLTSSPAVFGSEDALRSAGCSSSAAALARQDRRASRWRC